MPTATTPTTTPLKPATNQSTPASLRTLYNRAARAFLHRDIHQTHSLLQHAFSLLLPPAIHDDSDSLAPHRRKWDILRITLETTLYSSNNHHDHPLPDSLQQILSLPSHSLLTTLHQRSLALFTPTPTNPSSAYLPSQVLITLVLSSMKLNCAAAGRSFIEDWLGKSPGGGGEEYEKVLDIYCLHVLPRLEEWDYAFEFLQYENELAPQKRQNLISSLQTFHSSSHTPPSPPRTPTPTPQNPSPRCVSPSSSSSVSTTSTHTAVPRTPRPNARSSQYALAGLTPSSSSSSVASDLTVTPIIPNWNNNSGKRHTSPHSHTTTTTTKTPSVPYTNGSTLLTPTPPQPPPTTTISRPSSRSPSTAPLTRTTTSTTSPNPPTTLSLLRTSLSPYLSLRTSLRLPRLTTLLILFVLLPLFSLLLRIRRRRRLGLLGAGGAGAGEVVRRRLGLGGWGEAGLLGGYGGS